jgi:toxin ParE1/3/4
MKEPLISDEAKDDLAEIWAAIAEARDERTADRMLQKILASCRAKALFPDTGEARDEILPGLRSFPVRPYVVFYHRHADTILVLRILHGRRDVKRVIGGE